VVEGTRPVTLSYCDGLTAEVASSEEPKLTGEVIGKTILKHLDECNFSFNAAIAQGYDSAQVMSSCNFGTSATIKKAVSMLTIIIVQHMH